MRCAAPSRAGFLERAQKALASFLKRGKKNKRKRSERASEARWANWHVAAQRRFRLNRARRGRDGLTAGAASEVARYPGAMDAAVAVQCVLCNYTVIRNFAKTIALLGRVVRAAQIPPPLPPCTTLGNAHSGTSPARLHAGQRSHGRGLGLQGSPPHLLLTDTSRLPRA